MPFLVTCSRVASEWRFVSGELPASVGQYFETGKCRVWISQPTTGSWLPDSNDDCNKPFASSSGTVFGSQRLIIGEGYLDTYGDSEQPSRHLSFARRLANQIGRQGLDGIKQLTGSFVVVLVDVGAGKVSVWRDRLGGRTAYWHCSSDVFIVSSSAAMIAARLKCIKLDNHWQAHFFGLHLPLPRGRTAFSGIHELEPGECVEFRNGEVSRHRRPFPMPERKADRGERDWVEEFASVFSGSVRSVLPSRGGTAIMLSGGLDSGPTACMASDELSRNGKKLHVVSWALPVDGKADESRFIRFLAGELKQPLQLFDASSMLPFGTLNSSLVHPDYPLFNAFRSLVLECYRRAQSAGASVILNAAAGDRIYPHWNTGMLDLWRRGQLWEFARALFLRARHVGVTGLSSDSNVRHWAGETIPGLRRFWRASDRPKWLQPDSVSYLMKEELWPPEASRHHLPHYAAHVTGQAMAQGMAQEAAFSQQFGLDRRDPFHNENLIRLMLQMPVSMSYRDGMDKWVMREAMKGYMPESLRTKRRTGLMSEFFNTGFERHRAEIQDLLFSSWTDWQVWVRPDFIQDALIAERPDTQGMLVVSQCVGYVLWRQRLADMRIAID